LTLGLGESGEEWDIHRIGTVAEKSAADKELAELRERLSKVEEWKQRREEIEVELNKVWVDGGEELPPPAYAPVNAVKADLERSVSPVLEIQQEDTISM
jgi:ATP-binding cassette subfamily D (ALD) long-chain fatty acid import protein